VTGVHDSAHHFRARAGLIASHLRLPNHLIPHITRHLRHFHEGKSPLIWLQGQNCTGCSVSLLNSEHFQPANLASGKISLRYQPDIMSASGYEATDAIEKAAGARGGGYLLVIEGAIPARGYERFCTFGLTGSSKDLFGKSVPDDRSIYDWLVELVPAAEAVVAVGNCAVFGGIPSAIADSNGAAAAPGIVEEISPGKSVINVSGCPPHPDWLMGTLVDVLMWISGEKEAPELDENRRIKLFYGQLIHDLCERRPAFEEKRFLLDWNEAESEDPACLIKLGCRGPSTHADCPKRLWNSAVNWCVGANSPCFGCAEEGFEKKLPHKIPK
jgi:hydrogenase small subunit